MSSRLTFSACVRLCFCGLAGYVVPAFADVDQAGEPTVTLRAELRVAQPQGPGAYQFVPADKIKQGQEINYTVRIANPGTTTLTSATVIQPVPVNTRYVAGSATGAGADIEFSVDGGKIFARPGVLRSVTGSTRVAAAAEYTHIRWQLRYPLAPKAVVLARFRAVFE